jgi:hypothetical protein
MTRFGRTTGWKALAAFELGLDVKVMNTWQTVGVIPKALLGQVHGFRDEQIKPASRAKWTEAEKAALGALVEQGLSDRAVAQTLASRLGRRLVETSITGARRRFGILRDGRRMTDSSEGL